MIEPHVQGLELKTANQLVFQEKTIGGGNIDL